ncbi:hypothetical protein GCM10027590_32590 [Nocardiopsis nanhaiensis]
MQVGMGQVVATDHLDRLPGQSTVSPGLHPRAGHLRDGESGDLVHCLHRSGRSGEPGA